MQDLARRNYWGTGRRNLANFAALLSALLAILFLAAIVIAPAKAFALAQGLYPANIETSRG